MRASFSKRVRIARPILPATLESIAVGAKKLNEVFGTREGDELGDYATHQWAQFLREKAKEADPNVPRDYDKPA